MSLAPAARPYSSWYAHSFCSSPAIGALPVNAQGTEYHVSMSKILPQRFGAEYSDRLARADLLLRDKPDEEEDEEEDEDEGGITNDEGDDDEEEGGGYSVGMYY